MSFFKSNTELLESMYPGISRDLLESGQKSPDFMVEPTPSGKPTASWKGIWLHSKRDPGKEASRLVESTLPADCGCCIFLGFGLGYALEIFRQQQPEVPVILVEPDLTRFISALHARDMSHIFINDKVILIIGTSPEAVGAQLKHWKSGALGMVQLRGLHSFEKEYFDHVRQIVKTNISRRDVNNATLKRFGKRWVTNLFLNLNQLEAAGSVKDLYGQFKGIPALVTAAGPSLDLIVPHLPELRERMLIIAVDTASRAMKLGRTTPDILVVVDPQYWNTRHLDVLSDKDAADQPPVLISESSTHPRVFRLADSPVYFCSSYFPLGKYIEKETTGFGQLGAGGSVSTGAWDLARQCGCTTVYMAGLDLSFPNKQTHYRGSWFEERVHTMSSRLKPGSLFSHTALHDADPYPAEDNSGGRVLTDRRLEIYRGWFEGQLAAPDAPRTVNLSPGGIRIDKMEQAPVSDLLKLPKIRDVIDETLTRIRNGKKPAADPERLKATLSNLRNDLTNLAALAVQGKRLCQEYSTQTEAEQGVTLFKLEELDKKILGSSGREIASFLIDPLIKEVMKHISSEDPLETSLQLYTGLAESSAYHLKLLQRYLNS